MRLRRKNPYETRKNEKIPEGMLAYGDPRYAIPSLNAENGHLDDIGWAPSYGKGTPDPLRIQTQEPISRGPNPVRPSEYWNRIDADDKRRHSVEELNAIGGTQQKERSNRAPDPRWISPPEPRPQQRMTPNPYRFTRPFDQDYARRLNGNHFSMADHRRNYPILGMAPPSRLRNTFRQEPGPWDDDLVDLPPEYTIPDATIRSIDLPPRDSIFRRF